VAWLGLGTAEADALDKIIAEFQKAYPNVVVNQVPVDFNNLQNKFLTAAPQDKARYCHRTSRLDRAVC